MSILDLLVYFSQVYFSLYLASLTPTVLSLLIYFSQVYLSHRTQMQAVTHKIIVGIFHYILLVEWINIVSINQPQVNQSILISLIYLSIFWGLFFLKLASLASTILHLIVYLHWVYFPCVFSQSCMGSCINNLYYLSVPCGWINF